MSGNERAVQIVCADGPVLAGRLLLPAAGEPAQAVVVHGATGVPRDYYARFARWLADTQGAAVLTYDYRDFGHSAQRTARASKASMGDWGVKDQGAALDWLCAEFPELPVEVIGHSLGGMFLAFHAQAPRVRRMVAVATGPAYWTRHPVHFLPQVTAFWFLVDPPLTAALGYTPGKLLGGDDLPAAVFWQWRRWCTSPGFYERDWGKTLPVPDPSRVTGAVRLVGIADDVMISPPMVRDMARYYPAATVEHRVVVPADVGLKAIGHLRPFSERCKAVWPLLVGD